MRHLALAATAVALATTVAADAADQKRKPPYWASIQAGRARMRTGPARAYPASWLYQRVGLPVRVVAVFKEWRRVEDQDGTQGWILGNLISSTRTAVVRAATPIDLRERPDTGARLAWRAAPGVVGRNTDCRGNGWCRFDAAGRAGYTQTAGLWGVEPGETLP